MPGHWEGDFIKGAYNRSAVGVLVERKTRFVVLCRMDGCTAEDALAGFTRQMKKLPAFLRQSMTCDRGSEMACHDLLAKRLKLDIWFCGPHAPWQRGSHENTNGLLRQFLPKGADLSPVSQTMLNDIARLMTGRPRQTLNWRTPDKVMTEEIKKFPGEIFTPGILPGALRTDLRSLKPGEPPVGRYVASLGSDRFLTTRAKTRRGLPWMASLKKTDTLPPAYTPARAGRRCGFPSLRRRRSRSGAR